MNRILKNYIKIALFCVIALIVTFCLITYIKTKNYQKEYNSTEWYEVEAEFDHYNKTYRLVTEYGYDNAGDRVSYSTKEDAYDWVYKYTAENGSVHYYTENERIEPTGTDYTVKILVDKKDPAHNLEIRNDEHIGQATVMVIVFVLILLLIMSLPLVFVVFFLSKLISKIKK